MRGNEEFQPLQRAGVRGPKPGCRDVGSCRSGVAAQPLQGNPEVLVRVVPLRLDAIEAWAIDSPPVLFQVFEVSCANLAFLEL